MSESEFPNIPLWHSPPRWQWEPLAGPARADVCVVGLGGSGLAAIAMLLDRGLRVIGIDAGEVAGAAAGRNGGLLIAGTAEFHHDAIARFGHARAVRLYQKTLDWLKIVGRHPAPIVRWTGTLRLAADEDEVRDCRAQHDAMRADGFACEWYEGPEGTGFIVPGDAASDPVSRCRALAVQASERGAVLFEQTRAVEITPGLVTTPNGRIECDTVIVAVDGGLARLVPELRDRMRPIRLQMLGTAPELSVKIPRPVSYRYAYDYWQQLADGRVVFGGGRDRYVSECETEETETTAKIQAYMEEALRERLGVRAPITHRWAAQISYTHDFLPIMAEVRPKVWAIGGYSGTGNVIGAICADAVIRAALDHDHQGIDDWYVP